MIPEGRRGEMSMAQCRAQHRPREETEADLVAAALEARKELVQQLELARCPHQQLQLRLPPGHHGAPPVSATRLSANALAEAHGGSPRRARQTALRQNALKGAWCDA
jgi:hypothetical protein